MRVKLLGLIILSLVVALSASSAHAQAPVARIVAAYIGLVGRLAASIEAEMAHMRAYERDLVRELSELKVPREPLSTDDYLSQAQRELDRLRPLSDDYLSQAQREFWNQFREAGWGGQIRQGFLSRAPRGEVTTP